MNVYDLKIGQKATINTIYADGKTTKRLLALGCIEGTEIEVKKIAPLGDPIIINFRGFDMAIRKDTAKSINIKSKFKGE